MVQRLFAVVACFASLAASAQTVLWYTATDPSTGLESATRIEAPAHTFVLDEATTAKVAIRISTTLPFATTLQFAAPANGTLTVGPREQVGGIGVADLPFVNLAGPGIPPCFGGDSRYVILEIAYDGNSNLVKFAADFELRCTGENKARYGEIRIGSALPLTVDKAPGVTAPDAFAFIPRTQVPLGAVVESNATTLYGITAGTPVSITGGEYSLNGGPWIATTSNANPRDRVRVRLTAASVAGTARSATFVAGGVASAFSATTFSPGQPDTVLRFEHGPIGSNPAASGEVRAPNYVVSANHTRGQEVVVTFRGATGSNFYMVQLVAPKGSTLAPGAYEDAGWYTGSTAAVNFVDIPGCSPIGGRFVIFDLDLGPEPSVNRLAANFESNCLGGGTVFGEIRYQSAVAMRYMTTGLDTEPEPFAFVSQNPVQPGDVVVSNTITIVGVNGPVPVSIAGGEYSLNGGAFTTLATQAADKDRIVVRLQAPRAHGAAASATLSAGGQQGTLSVTTWAPGTSTSGFAYRSGMGHYIGQGRTVVQLSPSHPLEFRNGPGQVQLISWGPNGLTYSATISGPGRTLPAVGTYENVPPVDIDAPYGPTMFFSGDGRGCEQTTRRLVIHEAEYLNDVPQKLAIDFEHVCGSSPDTLRGEIRFNSTIPFTALAGGICTAGDSDGDGIPDCVELGETVNPYVKDNDVLANGRLFAMQAYRDFLGREGDPPGVDFWAGQVTGGFITRGQAIETFFNLPEFQGNVAPVVRLYSATFLRQPDFPGLDFWVKYRRAGNPLLAIADIFTTSGEFVQMYGALDNTQFVERIYTNILGRPADAGGRNFWVGQLASGAMSRGGVMLAFSESDEYRLATSSEVFVTMMYVGMLRRAADSAGFNFWVNYKDAGNPGLALIDLFLGSAEYRARFLP